jgi:biopolymer transport protein ExbD
MTGKDEREVFLRADATVHAQEMLEVFDRLKDGGIERVGIVALQRGK